MKGWSSWRQARRGCMVSAGRSVFWCPLVGAESDFCGRNGRWKGLIFRHNKVHVSNQGAVLKKSSLRGVHPGDFPSRQGENERRPISCTHSSWIKRSTLLCRKMTRVHPVVSFPLYKSLVGVMLASSRSMSNVASAYSLKFSLRGTTFFSFMEFMVCVLSCGCVRRMCSCV